MDECTYVDGVVFRKTVSHKKMMLVEESKHDDANDVNNKVGGSWVVCVVWVRGVVLITREDSIVFVKS
jgi:hypothetical protein